MKRFLRDEWVRMLRSGEVEQCTTIPYAGEGRYCVLGVLGLVAGISHNSDSFYEEISNIVGWTTKRRLWQMNDGYCVGGRKTFQQLADWIETNIPIEEEILASAKKELENA